MGNSNKKPKKPKNKETIAAILDRHIIEIQAVKTQEEFHDTFVRHKTELRPLTASEMKTYETERLLYDDALKKKREEFGITIKEKEVPQLKL
jgi:hypothetical protein